MATRLESIKVTDNRGFQYEVTIEHKPQFGFSTALYNGSIIGQVELGRITDPIGDDDSEWERYDELFAEWADEIRINMNRICSEYFNCKESV